MGALLSLPLLAVPSMGTVRIASKYTHVMALEASANHEPIYLVAIFCSKLLWSSDLLDGV
jgi:hypothetical protein